MWILDWEVWCVDQQSLDAQEWMSKEWIIRKCKCSFHIFVNVVDILCFGSNNKGLKSIPIVQVYGLPIHCCKLVRVDNILSNASKSVYLIQLMCINCIMKKLQQTRKETESSFN